MYRMQVYDDRTTGMHWQVHKVGARHGRLYYERNERMPVTVTIGGDPAYTFAATAPLPMGSMKYFSPASAQEIGRTREMLTNDLEVPADVDFVLEGYVQPGEMRPEGPFGDHTGFYTAVEDYPVFHLTAVTIAARRFIRPRSLVFRRWKISTRLGERANFLPVFKMNFPEIVDMALPAEGVFHNLVFVSIRKQYPIRPLRSCMDFGEWDK
jgi:4-hydroxy-3-polyprenylbenzoate decarboxylase